MQPVNNEILNDMHFFWLAGILNIIKNLNVEFEWPSDSLPEVAPVAGPPPSVSAELVRKALIKMKCGKATGPSGIIARCLKRLVKRESSW